MDYSRFAGTPGEAETEERIVEMSSVSEIRCHFSLHRARLEPVTVSEKFRRFRSLASQHRLETTVHVSPCCTILACAVDSTAGT